MKTRLLLLGLCAMPFVASAQVFDFEEFDGGNYSSLTSTKGGLTVDIYRTSGDALEIIDTSPYVGTSFEFPADWGARSLSSFPAPETDDYFVANFSTSLFAVSISMGDFGADVDELVLEAYSGLDGTGTLLASDVFSGYTGNINLDGAGITLSVSDFGGQIQSILFRGGDTERYYNSVYLDNLSAEAVPEPMTMTVLGLGALAALRRRSRKA